MLSLNKSIESEKKKLKWDNYREERRKLQDKAN
jgi:hypothetical protein